jgi:hypothetical protein
VTGWFAYGLTAAGCSTAAWDNSKGLGVVLCREVCDSMQASGSAYSKADQQSELLSGTWRLFHLLVLMLCLLLLLHVRHTQVMIRRPFRIEADGWPNQAGQEILVKMGQTLTLTTRGAWGARRQGGGGCGRAQGSAGACCHTG